MKSLAIVVALSGSASAGHRTCHEVSSVVGYQECSRFGVGWSGRSMSWELGGAVLELPFEPIDRMVTTNDAHATAPNGSLRVHAIRLRNVYGLTDHFYIASDLVLGSMSSMPTILIDVVARDGSTIGGQQRGWLTGLELAAGLRTNTGPLQLGGELAFGPRLALISTDRAPGALFSQADLALEARVHASVFLSPHWSAGVMLGTSMVERADTSITIAIALHVFPYDGGR
ncbi:MAG: hypothetical protein ABI591_05655 [Kofleriaceae bacterium]